jgi:hypothetical protein
MRRAIALTVLLVGSCGSLTAGEIEITPMFGYRWGGDFEADNSPLFTEDVEVDDSEAYGLTLGIRPNRRLIIELSANRQESRFIESDTLFGGSTELFDVDTTYYHVGIGGNWEFSDGEYETFLTGSLGLASIDPDAAGADTATEFSTSLGGGFKLWANHHFGFRFELRGFWANTGNDDGCALCVWDAFDDDLFQTEARIGLIGRF